MGQFLTSTPPMIARPVTTRRRLRSGLRARVVHEAAEHGAALAHHLPVVRDADLDPAPERERVEHRRAALGHRRVAQVDLAAAHHRGGLAALEVGRGDHGLRAAHELEQVERRGGVRGRGDGPQRLPGDLGARPGRAARPRRRRTTCWPSVTSRNATPATIQKKADIRCGAGDSHLTMPTAMSASGQKRKMVLPSTRPRLSSASTRPASITPRPITTRGVTLRSGDGSSGLNAGSIVCLRS